MVFVRKAQLKDVEELIKFNLNYGFTKKDIFNSDGDYYVCINNDIICGCGTLVINEDFCIIKNIIVMEEYKRKKIGTMIVKTMLNAAEIKGIETAEVLADYICFFLQYEYSMQARHNYIERIDKVRNEGRRE